MLVLQSSVAPRELHKSINILQLIANVLPILCAKHRIKIFKKKTTLFNFNMKLFIYVVFSLR